jgi:uncharacterized protein DUF1203
MSKSTESAGSESASRGDTAAEHTVGEGAVGGGTVGWIVEPIPAAELEKIRNEGYDEAGNPVTAQVDGEGGSPLRCCLRETRPGERVLLIAYTPPGTAGAYAERGPVFVHADACEGYRTPGEYPPELRHRRQVVRAYDREGRIAGAVLAGGGDEAVAAVAFALSRPDVALVHLRNVEYGCYNFAVRKISSLAA